MQDVNIGFLKLRVTGWLTDEELDELDEVQGEHEECFFAEGTYAGLPQQSYNVTIHYRDPQAPNQQSSVVRIWTLEVVSGTSEDAMKVAERDFRLIESLCSGGWRREILEVTVE